MKNKKFILIAILGVFLAMAVILIPSRCIYSIDNQKVIDNQVDKVEVEQKDPQIVNDSENVYNEKVECQAVWAESQSQSNHMEKDVMLGGEIIMSLSAVAYVEVTPSYIMQKFTIPKTANNSAILRIFTGEDENGYANIRYSLIGDITKGDLSGNVIGSVGNTISYKSVNVNNPNNITVTTGASYTLTPNFDYTANYENVKEGQKVSTTINFKLYDSSTILTATATENDNDFTINLTILNGLIIKKLEGGTTFEGYYGETQTVNLNGTYEKYQPTQVNISFYGNTIKLDLEKETFTIGNGNHTMSFNGNELMQTTNTPTIEDMYRQVIGQYKNGKEVATIRCGIENYYDSDENIVISKSRKNNLPMTFHIGDIVVPYVYGANGKDKPMSIKKDGTAKDFEVLGKKTIYDGGIWQELTLQEYDKTTYVKIELVDKTNNPQDAYITIRVIFGELNEGDVIEYNGEKARVYEGGVGLYIIDDLNGVFYNAVGETIIVTKV